MRAIINLGLLIGCAILLSSCVSTMSNKDPRPSQSWNGANVNELIKYFGTPDSRISTPGGHTILVYRLPSYSTPPPPASPAIGVNNRGGRPVMIVNANTNGNPAPQPTLICTLLFEANQQGIVIKTKTQGRCPS